MREPLAPLTPPLLDHSLRSLLQLPLPGLPAGRMEEDDLPGDIGVVEPDGGAGRAFPSKLVPRSRWYHDLRPDVRVNDDAQCVSSEPPRSLGPRRPGPRPLRVSGRPRSSDV